MPPVSNYEVSVGTVPFLGSAFMLGVSLPIRRLSFWPWPLEAMNLPPFLAPHSRLQRQISTDQELNGGVGASGKSGDVLGSAAGLVATPGMQWGEARAAAQDWPSTKTIQQAGAKGTRGQNTGVGASVLESSQAGYF